MNKEINEFKKDLSELLAKYGAVITKEEYNTTDVTEDGEYTYESISYKFIVGQNSFDIDDVIFED